MERRLSPVLAHDAITLLPRRTFDPQTIQLESSVTTVETSAHDIQFSYHAPELPWPIRLEEAPCFAPCSPASFVDKRSHAEAASCHWSPLRLSPHRTQNKACCLVWWLWSRPCRINVFIIFIINIFIINTAERGARTRQDGFEKEP
jgi:hypothetical protein